MTITTLTEERKKNIQARFLQYHKIPKDIPGHAYEVWEDGEITLTKCSCGKLYGMRTLHCIVSGTSNSLPIELFPEQTNNHGLVRIAENAEAVLLREIILSNL